MKQRILQVITSMLLILTLTMVNFLFVCVDVVSYAADSISIDKNTNNKNVEFMSYFKDGEGNKISQANANINNNDLKLYFQISVKQEGYFNGNIILNNANFKLKADLLSDAVNRIDGNTIYLNQINAGDSKEIEVGIELIADEQFDLNYINFESEIAIEGIYRNSSEKDISIKSKRNVILNIANPYIDANEDISLLQEVITNKILQYNGEEKRVIQIKVKSGLNNNLFPASKTIINMQAPKISDKYPSQVLINSNSKLVTNGKTLTQDNWNYNSENGTVSINIENNKENNKVSWIKNGQDEFIVTYIFDKEVNLNNEKLDITSEINLYDDNSTVIRASSENTLDNVQKDSIVTSNISENETIIYKGKLYAGISRDITYKNAIDVNLNNVATEINVKEDKQLIGEQQISSVYRTTKLNKTQIENILGENGTLSIINAETGSEISTINKYTQANDEGNIVVAYPKNVQSIIIKLSMIEKIGKIEIETTKTINSIERNIVKSGNSINSNAIVSYVSNNIENQLQTSVSNIELKETETSAELQVNRTELSAMASNNNVEFRVILKSKEEKDELFENAVLKLELPEKIQNIQVNSIKLLYEDEMKIKTAVLNNKTIEITLDGEQTKYKEEAIDGAIIIINANLATDLRTANSTEQIRLTYTNGKAINYKDGAKTGTAVSDINIVSYAGVVTTNQIKECGIDVVNNEGTKETELAVSSDAKDITIEKNIINNKENKISNVRILGTFPTKEAIAENNIDATVSNINVTGVDSSRVKIYYSNNANATEDISIKDNNWSENIGDSKIVKKYLAVINQMDLLEQLNLSYKANIPSNLEYSQSALEGYTVYYTSMTTEEKVDTEFVKLGTLKGTVVETTLKGLVAGEESQEVKENEILRYEATISNTGSEDVSNVKITANVPEGTTFVNSDRLNNDSSSGEIEFLDEEKENVEMTIDNLAKGETVTKYYEVQVNENLNTDLITNAIKTQYGEVTKTSNEVKTTVNNDGRLQLQLVSVDAVNGIIKSGYGYRYVLNITNNSNEEIKNVKTIINKDDLLKISEIYYINSKEVAVTEKDSNEIEIDSILAGQTVEVAIQTTVNVFKDSDSKQVSISAVSTVDNNEYKSNEVTVTAESNLTVDMSVTSENAGGYVNGNDVLKYNITLKNTGKNTVNNIELYNWISNNVTITKVSKNNQEMEKNSYSLEIDSEKNQKVLKIDVQSLASDESAEYTVETIVNMVFANKKDLEIANTTLVKVDSLNIETSEIKHILKPTSSGLDTGEDGNEGNNNNNNGSNSGNNGSSSEDMADYKIISGTAWIDENEDGKKDVNEKIFEGLKVKLLDITTNEFVKNSNGDVLETSTSSTGFYSFTKVVKGQYMIIFEYDNTQYGLTTFEKDGVSNEVNSNVIAKTIKIDNKEEKVAATEVVKVEDNNITNVNIGLIQSKKYDLQLDKYVSKVIVQNKETKTSKYTDTTIVKEEIDAKQVNSTTVIVEYTIKVTNKGDVDAYVKKIADYLSSDYKFSSELNKDWYQSGSDIYCTSLANEKIEPGKSKEVVLTVIKTMTENNTGLINNTAEIVSSYNEYGLTDINSTEGNKVKGENDMGSADLIISIKTGQVVTTVMLVITTIIIIGVSIYLVKRKFITGKVM